jgi:hypothetical protein
MKKEFRKKPPREIGWEGFKAAKLLTKIPILIQLIIQSANQKFFLKSQDLRKKDVLQKIL